MSNTVDLPLYAVGASSGGTFVSLLLQHPQFSQWLRGVGVYISPGHPLGLQSMDVLPAPLRRVVFVYMPRDTMWATTEAIFEAKEVIEAKRSADGRKVQVAIAAAEVRCRRH